MTEPAPESLIVLLGAPPMPGELIASYLRYRLPKVAIKLYASCADLKPGAASARGFVLIETSARNAPNIAEAIARIRSDHPQTPILIASASPDAGSAVKAMRRGAQGFIPHLTPLSDLVNALQTVLDGRTCFPQLVPSDGRADGGAGLSSAPAPPPSPSRSTLRLADERAPGESMHPRSGLRRSDSSRPPVSVELVITSDEASGADAPPPYSGPCRRRRTAANWTGPERRRAAAHQTG